MLGQIFREKIYHTPKKYILSTYIFANSKNYVYFTRNSILENSDKFILLFINTLFLFAHLLQCTNPMILLDAMLKTLIMYLFFLKCVLFFISIMTNQKSNVNNSFRIIFIKN